MNNQLQINKRSSLWGSQRLLTLFVAGLVMLSLGANSDTSSDDQATGNTLDQIRNATAAEKEALRLKRERFLRLSSEEQNRLREFHSELEEHPDHERLRRILENYNEWLRTLTPAKRAEIQDLPTEERIEKIKEVQEEEARRVLGFFGETKLPEQDVPGLYAWIDLFVAQNEKMLLEKLPDRVARDVNRSRKDESRRRRIAFYLTGLTLEELQDLVSVSDAESLFNGLSEEAKAILGNRESDEERILLVQRWIRFALIARNIPRVSDDELETFYREKLDDEERHQLDRMPPTQRKQRLIWMYHSRNTGQTSENRSDRGGRDGDGRGGSRRGESQPDQLP